MPIDMKFAHFFSKIDQLGAVTCLSYSTEYEIVIYPARALRVLGLLLADSALTVGRGKTF